ncbi:MAG: hypothetical protein LBL64_00510 [Treponema sp.]|jgi:hypothetical protein|nr:hypothetical protein [Treponema sp.]
MTHSAWQAFCKFRRKFRNLCEKTAAEIPRLKDLQQRLAETRQGPAYTVDTPVVYNETLDSVTKTDEIKLILVADNPGRKEQALENRRYLVGPSGKLAEKFFRENPVLGIDFRKNVIILNKTPIHTPRTGELRELCRAGGPELQALVETTQKKMVDLLQECYYGLSKDLENTLPVWITGYSEMKEGGIFAVYTESLKAASPGLKESLFLYRHFSMNQFTIDLARQRKKGESLQNCLDRIGLAYRLRIVGV